MLGEKSSPLVQKYRFGGARGLKLNLKLSVHHFNPF